MLATSVSPKGLAMPRCARRLAESGIYHVMLRGVNRDAIFLEDEDRRQFLSALQTVRDLSGCIVLAYCLMTNHVHLILRTTDEPIASVVKRLGVRYAGWFNRKYGRVGHLFQDRFRSRPVDDDAYFVTLLRYVWSNPVDAGIVATAESYPWSSRRLLGRPSSLLDEAALQNLLPVDPTELLMPYGGDGSGVDVPSPPLPGEVDAPRKGRPPRHSDEEVTRLVLRACGAGGPATFGRLSYAEQQRVIRELRTRQVSCEQIARATGLGATTVRRMHAAGEPPAADVA